MNSFRRKTKKDRNRERTLLEEVEISVVIYLGKEIEIYIYLCMFFLIFLGFLGSEFFPGKNSERIRSVHSFRPERIRFWKQFEGKKWLVHQGEKGLDMNVKSWLTSKSRAWRQRGLGGATANL